MLKLILAISTVALAISFGVVRPAAAQGAPGGAASATRGLGVGAESMLTTPALGVVPATLAVVYDGGRWHADGLFGITNFGRGTPFILGARGWFHLHTAASADFSIGGGLGIAHWQDDETTLQIEMGFQFRAFLVSNVALTATGGIGISTLRNDRDGFLFGGQPVGALGLIYFF